MKKAGFLIAIIILSLFTSCDNNSAELSHNDGFKDIVFDSPEDMMDIVLSDDVVLYNSIIKRLEEVNNVEILYDMKSQIKDPIYDEAFAELAVELNMQVDEIKDFLCRVFAYAVGFKEPVAQSETLSPVQLISCVGTAMSEIITDGFEMSSMESDWNVEIAGLKVIMKSDSALVTNGVNASPGGEPDLITHSVTLEIEFIDDTYKKFKIKQLIVDGINLD